jgi:hypothetical protein
MAIQGNGECVGDTHGFYADSHDLGSRTNFLLMVVLASRIVCVPGGCKYLRHKENKRKGRSRPQPAWNEHNKDLFRINQK